MDRKSMNELLLELFSEEIPARMQVKAASQMMEVLEKKIKELDITYNKAEYFVTPRRVVLYIAGLPSMLLEKTIERKGPRLESRPEAIEGFLRSTGMKLNELVVVDGFYYAKKKEASKPIAAILKEIIEQMLLSFTWPKSMRMNSSRVRWVRPLRNILCIFAGDVLPVTFGELQANNYSFGHRFMAPERVEISSFDDYKDKMRKAYVILSGDERRNIIVKQISEITKDLGLTPVLDKDLLEEVVGLVEYPNSLLGKIDQKFLEIPKEVLVCAMKTHQRYFYLENADGKIAPYFLVVANIKHDQDDIIRVGNEKVLAARLSDAKFFWDVDLKQPSSANLAKLSKVTFHHKLGTVFDKVNRIIALSEYISSDELDKNLVKKAALLCKTDLVSEVVGEFPELQGVMGQYYALEAGEEPEVSLAIAEHYRPISAQDRGDVSKIAAVIAIADKIDSIVGLWLAGEKPTSSKDPFALRRSALGIIKLIRYHKFDISLSTLIEESKRNYELDNDKSQQEILEFFQDRLKYYLKGEGFRHDLIMAVIDGKDNNIYNVINRVEDLQKFILTDEASEVVFAMKRVDNILAQSKEIKLDLNQDLFNGVERELYESFIQAKNATCCKDLISLSKYISQFFDKIMVNDSDNNLKQNRLNLLRNISHLSKNIADFNLIEV